MKAGPVDVHCGLEIDYKPERRTARIRQTRHIDMMFKLFRMTGARPERFPLPTGRPGELAAQRWTGEATERSHFDYAMFIGDLVWVMKTRFDLKHAAHLLAQQMCNPALLAYLLTQPLPFARYTLTSSLHRFAADALNLLDSSPLVIIPTGLHRSSWMTTRLSMPPLLHKAAASQASVVRASSLIFLRT